jgi:hypothetical protein
MAEQKSDEKREYVRADLTTQVKVQPVSREEFERHKTVQTDSALDDTYPDESNTPDTQFGLLIQRMNRIEEKIDKIFWKLNPESRPDEVATYGTAHNISGAGVSLFLNEEMDVGQLVLVSLSVPGFSIGFLQAYGEVVRVSKADNMGQQSFDTSIKFLIINETEREILISYSFRRQRQEIRNLAMAKEKNGNND